jgi:hypothetical protein
MRARRAQTDRHTAMLPFPEPMSTPIINSEVRPTPPESREHRHGNTAQWGALIVAALAFVGLLAKLALAVYFHYAAGQAQASDGHIKQIIGDQVNPELKSLNTDLGKRMVGLSGKIDGLSDRVSRIEGSLNRRVSSLETQAGRQASLAKLQGPGRTLALIRAEIETAEMSGKLLAASDLADYRNVALELPPSANEYWTTLAAIINYQSKLNQMSGEAPDPLKISKVCGGLTNNENMRNLGNNYMNERLTNCVIDLDNESFFRVTFINSVIRYSGGPVNLNDVRFLNCRFILSVDAKTKPVNSGLLLVLLDSSDQKDIRLNKPATH